MRQARRSDIQAQVGSHVIQSPAKERRDNFPRRISIYTWYLIPPLFILFIINALPLLYTFYLSFHKWVLYRQKTPEFVGLENWIAMLSSDRFWHSLKIEVLFVVGAVALEFVLGLAIALFLNREMRARDLIRSLFLFPMVLPPIIAAFLWRFMLQSDIGVINYYLRFVNLDRAWLASSATALPTLIVVDVWQFTPFVILLLLAGLQQLPPEVYEAAEVDGASVFQRFRYITIPLLMPTMLVVLLLRTVEALKVFPTIYVLTGGGPGQATEALNFLAYHMAFTQSRMGYGATLSAMILLLSIIIAVLFIFLSRRTQVEIE
ncbi:MAG: sugar ABC transporter permease [Anaerolineae bacterium]